MYTLYTRYVHLNRKYYQSDQLDYCKKIISVRKYNVCVTKYSEWKSLMLSYSSSSRSHLVVGSLQ